MWPGTKSSQTTQLDPNASSAEALFHSIQKLSPQNDEQRSLKSQALQVAVDLGQTRWLLFEQTETSISLPMLIILVFWMAIVFVSGLFAPPNATAIVTLMLAALSVSAAIFLILELDSPFHGVIQISPGPMRNALAHLGR